MVELWVEIPKFPACVSLRFSEFASKRFFHWDGAGIVCIL